MTILAAPFEPTTAAPDPDTSGRSGRLQHLPALDGLRGIAVVAVLLFHGGFSWAQGGWLGVSVFFTVSGFLITNLLVAEWSDEGSISLKTFWSRRFRRLMPAAIATLLLVALYGLLWASPEQLRNLRIDLLAALAYVANWRFLLADFSYADLFSAPSPVQHFWSLAIEEQFYVAYPLVVLGLLKAGGRRALGVVLGVATVGSVAWSLAHADNLDRVYYGTDTRMAELLVGGLVALWWSGSATARAAPATRGRRTGVTFVGLVGLAGSLALWPSIAKDADFVTRGALPLQAFLSVCLVVAGARPGLVSRALSWPGFTAVGLVSYGLYLYHWPVFLVLDEERLGLSNPMLFVVRMLVTTLAAVVSFHLLEQPIRRRRIVLGVKQVGPAIAFGVLLVVASTVAVTWDPAASNIAHADVSLADQEITVATLPPDAPKVRVVPGAPDAVMIVGDSGTFDAAPAIGALYQRLGTTEVIDASFPGFGLTQEPAGWRTSFPELVAEYRPDLIVVMLGGWDERFVEEEGRAAYAEVLEDATEILTAAGGEILWLGMLPGEEVSEETQDQMEPFFRALARRHPDSVTFGEIDPAVEDGDGEFPRWIEGDDGELVLARKPDGWHLCPDGAERIAQVVGELTAEAGWTPEPRLGWERGDWRSTARYDDPPGGCDESRPENAPPDGG